MKTNRIVFCFIIMGFIVKGQIRSIEVQSQTDMRKIYFDYSANRLEIIDQFGNVRTDAKMQSYRIQFKLPQTDTSFDCFGAELPLFVISCLNTLKKNTDLHFQNIKIISEYGNNVYLPDCKSLWIPAKAVLNKNKK